MSNDPHWIEHMHMKKGAFTKKAKAAGSSVAGYAKKVTAPGSTASAKTKRQGALAKTLGGLRKR